MAEALTNGVTEAALRALVHGDLKFVRQIKALRDARKAHRSHIKTYGIELEDFDAAVKQMNAEDDGELFVRKLEAKHKLMSMLGLQVAKRFAAGDQMKLPLDEPKKNVKSKAFRSGEAANLLGLDESDVPHNLNTEEGQDWVAGFRHSESMVKKGSDDLKLLEKGEDPDNPKAAKGTLPSRAPKPLEEYAGKATKAAGAKDTDKPVKAKSGEKAALKAEPEAKAKKKPKAPPKK